MRILKNIGNYLLSFILISSVACLFIGANGLWFGLLLPLFWNDPNKNMS